MNKLTIKIYKKNETFVIMSFVEMNYNTTKKFKHSI